MEEDDAGGAESGSSGASFLQHDVVSDHQVNTWFPSNCERVSVAAVCYRRHNEQAQTTGGGGVFRFFVLESRNFRLGLLFIPLVYQVPKIYLARAARPTEVGESYHPLHPLLFDE